MTRNNFDPRARVIFFRQRDLMELIGLVWLAELGLLLFGPHTDFPPSGRLTLKCKPSDWKIPRQKISLIIERLRKVGLFFTTFLTRSRSYKLFFFANKEFFRFLLISLYVCYIWKKFIDDKMTQLSSEKRKREKSL